MQEQAKKPHEDGIAVRPHHGLCGEFFQGKGYSGEFVGNMSAVLDMLGREDPLITLTVGADRICCRCPNNMEGHCETEEKVTRYDNAVLNLCGLSDGDILRWGEFRSLVREKIISPGLLSQVCGDCMWFYICGKK